MNSFNINVFINGKMKLIIKPSIFHYYADPFILESNSSYIVLIAEEYQRIRRKGRIVILKINLNTFTLNKQIILDEKYHLSYPYVFSHNNIKFFSPESSILGKQFIYSIRKQDDFYIIQNCFEIKLRMVDASFMISEHNKNEFTIYYYTGVGNADGMLVKSKFFIIDNCLISPTESCIIDARRPAGNYSENILPLQIISSQYGKGFALIDLNTKQNVRDEETKFESFLTRGHHISKDGNNIVIDTLENFSFRLFDFIQKT